MLINQQVTVNLTIETVADLPKLRTFMETNDLKINKSEIARQLNVDRRTVGKYLDGYQKPEHRNKTSKVDVYEEIIRDLLSSESQIFFYKRVLWQYLTDNHGMNIPLPTFYHYIQNHPEFDRCFSKGQSRGKCTIPTIRFESEPGKQAQLDWKESIPFVLADTGELIRISILTLLLGNSRYRIYKPSLQMTQDILINSLVEIFDLLGGVPHEIVTDNMKTVMDIARTKYYPGKINKRFEAFAKDFGFKVCPCIANTPQTKGKVESQMRLLDEIQAYSGQLTLIQLHEKIAELNNRINSSIHKGTGKIPLLDFKKEKDSLLPLPHESVRNQYRIKTSSVKVNGSSLISIHSMQYSVPTRYIGQTVQYQIHDGNAYVYYNTSLIAMHTLSTNKLNYAEDHYRDILTTNYPYMAEEDIRSMARSNLRLIGERYAD